MNPIETERLILRPFTEQDAKALLAILGDEKANTFLPMFPLRNMQEARAYLRNKHRAIDSGQTLLYHAVCRKDDNIPVGYIQVSGDESYDLGYGLRRDLWRNGICSEACRAVIDGLKRTGHPYLTATHDVNNPGSGEVMQSVGMTYRYSYEELWQPKNFPVTFRMYQINLDGQENRVFRKYWDKYPVHFIERDIPGTMNPE